MKTYDITDAGIGSIIDREPDQIDINELQYGDKIGCWKDMLIVETKRTESPYEEVLMCYVASIQPGKKFKVYAEWGDRTSIEMCSQRGRKVRDEAFAKQLFPMLSDYEFMVN